MASKRQKDKEKRRQRRLSKKQREANITNAQLSTGPNTAPGKEKSAENAKGDCFYSVDPVAPWEDPAEYRRFKQAIVNSYAPQTEEELFLAERIAAESWRLKRIPLVEARILHDHEADLDRMTLELRRLTLNELRIERLRVNAKKELQEMQTKRLGETGQTTPADRRSPDSVGAPMRGEHATQNVAFSEGENAPSQAGFAPNAEDQMGSFRAPLSPPDGEEPNFGDPPVRDVS